MSYNLKRRFARRNLGFSKITGEREMIEGLGHPELNAEGRCKRNRRKADRKKKAKILDRFMFKRRIHSKN